jgi:hypothetical protein
MLFFKEIAGNEQLPDAAHSLLHGILGGSVALFASIFASYSWWNGTIGSKCLGTAVDPMHFRFWYAMSPLMP